jgi:hypothetical protein
MMDEQIEFHIPSIHSLNRVFCTDRYRRAALCRWFDSHLHVVSQERTTSHHHFPYLLLSAPSCPHHPY